MSEIEKHRTETYSEAKKSFLYKTFQKITFKARNEFFNLFDIASIFAYTLSFVAVMIFVEYAIISPIERRLNKWRTT